MTPYAKLFQNDRKGVNVAGASEITALLLLWRHVAYGSDGEMHTPSVQRVLANVLSQAEVEHLYIAIGPDHDVFWLYVAVDNLLLVSGRQRARYLTANLDDFGRGKPARFRQRPE